MGQMYLKVSFAVKEELERKSLLLVKVIIISKSYDYHRETKGWMGSPVVLPRGNQLHVTPNRHQPKPSSEAFKRTMIPHLLKYSVPLLHFPS